MIRFLVLLLHPYLVQSLEKHWLPDLEWQTAGNWANGRVPEVDSRVIFPEDMKHAAGFPQSGEFRLSEIDLPRDGSLVLPANGKLQLSSRKSHLQKEARWNRMGDLLWADPNNWNYSSEAVPHLERIPCRMDTMVLPARNKTFSIRLPRKNVQVKGIRLADDRETFTDWEWQRMKMKREFTEGYFTVRYSNLFSCEDCECQSIAAEPWDEVCEIQLPRCGLPACVYPLMVEGHCCIYCGARILLPSAASLRRVENVVRESLKDSGIKVSWHVRKRRDGNKEVLLVESGVYDGLSSAKAANILADKIREHGVNVISLELAGAALTGSKLSVVLGPLLGAPLVVLIFLLILFPYYGYSYGHGKSNGGTASKYPSDVETHGVPKIPGENVKILQSSREAWVSIREGIRSEAPRSSGPFDFARFENVTEANVELTSSPGDNEANEHEELSAGGRFANPLYRSKRAVAEDKGVLKVEGTVTMADLYDRVDNDEYVEDIEMNLEN